MLQDVCAITLRAIFAAAPYAMLERQYHTRYALPAPPAFLRAALSFACYFRA